MKAHKNFSIAGAIFMALTVFSGFNKKWRHTHVLWGVLMVICFMGAMITGKQMITPKKAKSQGAGLSAEDLADAEDFESAEIPDPIGGEADEFEEEIEVPWEEA